MLSLTQAQAELLAFIQSRIAADGIAPSFEEMRQHLGLRSKSGVHRMVEALEERGRIARMHNRARAIEIVDRPPDRAPLTYFSSNELVAELARRSGVNRHAA